MGGVRVNKDSASKAPRVRSGAAPAVGDHGGARSALAGSPLDRAPTPTRTSPWMLAFAALAHAAGGAVLVSMPPIERTAVAARAEVTHMVEVDLAPPAPEPEPPAPEPEPEPEPPPPPRPRIKRAPPPAPVEPPPPPPPVEQEVPDESTAEPAPEAAATPEVLTRAPDVATPTPVAPVVSGKSAGAMVGGQSAASGTAQRAVRTGQARVSGVEGARGTAPVNRARPPRLVGGASWDCPWPEEGDMVDEDEPTVTLRVRVTASGQVRQVTVVKDPGYGFGREARRCAMRKRWQPGLDPNGQPAELVALVAVRFRS